MSNRPETVEQISVIINGEQRRAPAGQTVASLLVWLGLDPSRVAVELDRVVVPRQSWAETAVGDGARLEIVQFVGGG